MKEKPWVTEFLKAVYPEMTDLAVTIAHTEEKILTDAATLILELERELDEAKKILRWYADPDNWNADSRWPSLAEEDAGDRARAAGEEKSSPRCHGGHDVEAFYPPDEEER